jgi:hypothetical protein
VAEQQSAVALANERMSIIDACNELGMEVRDFSIASLKVHCPFGQLTHADGGQSRAFRIYPDTNSAWCFACQQYFNPVILIAMDRGITNDEAAEYILAKTNYVAPDFVSRWDALMAQTYELNTTDLAEALKVSCARMVPDWEERQFEDVVSERLRLCLGKLPRLKTQEDASKWLAIAKQAMRQALGV